MLISKPDIHDLQNPQSSVSDDSAKDITMDMFSFLFMQLNPLIEPTQPPETPSTTLHQNEMISPSMLASNPNSLTVTDPAKDRVNTDDLMEWMPTHESLQQKQDVMESANLAKTAPVSTTALNTAVSDTINKIDDAQTKTPSIPITDKKAELTQSIPSLLFDNKPFIPVPVRRTIKELLPVGPMGANKNITTVLPMTTLAPEDKTNTDDPTPLATVNTKVTDLFLQLGQFVNSHTSTVLTPAMPNIPLYSATLPTPPHPAQEVHHNTETQVEYIQLSTHTLGSQVYDAKINIYPKELGHLIAKLKVDKNNAELIILTPSQQVKEIVESNMPNLRENFQKADINLTQVQIQNSLSGDHAHQQTEQQDKSTYMNRMQETTDDPLTLSSSSTSSQVDTLIDTYA